MNVNDYIASGTLELYVAGVLSEEETREIAQMAQEYPEVAKEIEAIEEYFLTYAEGHAVEPSKGLKSSVMDAIEEEATGQNSDTKSETYSTKEAKSEHYQIGRQKQMNLRPYWIALAASILLLIISGYYNYRIYTKYQDTREELVALRQEKEEIAQNLNKARQNLEDVRQEYNYIQSPNTRFVDLKGVSGHESDAVRVFWNPDQQVVFLNVKQLPEPPSGKQYQLWAIQGKKPVSAGVFDYKEAKQQLAQMQDIDKADAFAITLEPKGGSQTPTMEQMYVKGAI